jgi:Leucine-rich repeat (LRR) protein
VIPPKIFQNNINLKYLDLSNNRIKIIDKQNINVFKKLLFLDFETNICTAEKFEFNEADVERGTARIIEAILFPLCEDDNSV